MNRASCTGFLATLALTSTLVLPGAAAARGLEPLSLARGDWDGDGTLDVIAGFAAPGGGRLAFHRGNPDAVYPNEPGARKGPLTTPFSTAVRSVALPGRPGILAAGDFDADGRLDLAAAALGSEELVWLRGDGRGRFGKARTVSLPGSVTALAAGEMNRRDGFEDLLVAVSGRSGPELLVFDSLLGTPEKHALPAEATALATGQLDEHFAFDAAVLAGGEVFVLSGWDRHPGAKAPRAALKRLPASAGAGSLAVGRFAESARIDDVAVLAANGAVEVMTWNLQEKSWRVEEAARLEGSDLELQPAAVASPTGRGFLALDRRVGSAGLAGSGGLEDVVPAKALATRPSDAAVAVLPMRLNPDGLDDVVVLRRDGTLGVVYAKVATTYTVNTTSDTNDGVCNAAHCSLREAITLANGNAGADTIQFNIAGAGTKTITPGSFLPVITEAVTIDGTTQPGYGSIPLIELNGTSVSTITVSGLRIEASNCVIRGLAINRFASAAGIFLISSSSARTGNIIEGNRLGTNPAGTVALANGDGVAASGQVTGTLIGGTTSAASNTLSGNVGAGAFLFTVSNTVLRNYIGTQTGGSGSLGNGFYGIYLGGASNTIGNNSNGVNFIGNNGQYGIYVSGNGTLVRANIIGGDAMVGGPNADSGIYIESDNNTIGSTQGAHSNTIFNNGGDGVEVASFATGNLIRHNSIYNNARLGIELGFGGVTANDVGDGDTGANDKQNFPVITAKGASAVGLSLNSTPNTTFILDLYSVDAACDPSGHGEGNSRVNGGTITTDATGNGTVIIPVPFAGTWSATATSPGSNTSEFSACF